MHEQNLKDAIFVYIFNDEDMYRRHYVPTVHHMIKNPKNKARVAELVDNATMKFCKNNNMEYAQIPEEVKNELMQEIYQEIIQDEVTRNR